MADTHLEFLRTVPGPPKPLGPVPPLDPVPARPDAIDAISSQRSELQKRLDGIGRERASLVARMRRDHAHFVELEAIAGVLAGAMVELERHRLTQESGDGA